MKISVERIFCGEKYSIGKLYLNGEYFCDTIENPVRVLPPFCPETIRGILCKCKEKVYTETAIPAGTYKVTLEYSPRYKKILPRLHDVPHFTGILIHSGNTAKDTAGCLIVGKNNVVGKVLDSRTTMESLIKRLDKENNITIEVV
ncbi:MAG: DUF5675 family protein [Alistipes sp.]|nr:DUF5675 family protein [Alistipes sp.]